MPRIAIENVKPNMFYQGNASSRGYILDLLVFGSGMPEGRPFDNTQAEVVINFDDTLTNNRTQARQAILANVRAQGITIADNAKIDTVSQFFQSL